MAGPTVREWMHVGVVTCRLDTPVAEVARLMRAEDVSGVVVVDRLGLLAGVISRTDLAEAAGSEPHGSRWKSVTARDLMTTPVLAVEPDLAVADALEELRRANVQRLVVTVPSLAGREPVGILSRTDLVARLSAPPSAAR